MPLKYTRSKGKPAIKWGDKGKPYTYKAGSKSSREQAKEKALRQMKAIKANQGK